MTKFSDQDIERYGADEVLASQMREQPISVDRRSTARRVADRSIIADQAETIRALEGQLALAKDQSGARLKMLEVALTAHTQVEEQRDEAVGLLREVSNYFVPSERDLGTWNAVEDFLNSLDTEEG